MKIAGTVILYHPAENVIENISSYLNSVDILYIVDNTENPSKRIADTIKALSSAIYLHDGENKGIAARLNQISNLAISGGFEWLLTMDQDSSFENETLNSYFTCIRSFEQKEKVSMFGINFEKKVSDPNVCHSIKVNHLITSGSLLNLSLFRVMGGFEEKLFIDEVDFEYCLRSIKNGFQIIQFRNIFLSHHLGKTSLHRSLKSTKLTSRVLHSPVRIYYMSRNFLFIQSKYRVAFPEELSLRKKILINRIKNNVLYNKNRFKVLNFILKGIIDYRKKRMGRLK